MWHSKNTVKKSLGIYKALGMPWEEIERLDDKALGELFVNVPSLPVKPRLEALHAFFPYMHKELRKTGVTRKLLWEEYHQQHPDGYQLTQFWEHYRRCNKRISPSMRIKYKAGDKILVDYSGKKLHLVDPKTGEVHDVEVCVAILGASQLLYVEASPSQQKADFIGSCENALHYIGGVTQAIVTDNLKRAVTKSHRYAPKLNTDFAEHYGLAVLPTRYVQTQG